jgi:hypothetical protein
LRHISIQTDVSLCKHPEDSTIHPQSMSMELG